LYFFFLFLLSLNQLFDEFLWDIPSNFRVDY
jgi:hypothetical protein